MIATLDHVSGECTRPACPWRRLATSFRIMQEGIGMLQPEPRPDTLRRDVLALLHTMIWLAWLPFLFSFSGTQTLAAENASEPNPHKPIPIARIKRSTPVDFDKEILPILKNNCLACHNKTTSKAGLILETPADMLKGGDSGPAISPKHGSTSLILKVAAHQEEDIVMPPPGNKVQAANLTSDELGFLKLWIDQGAKASAVSPRNIDWQPLPDGLNAIFAVALTADGHFAACSRANQIFIYHLPSGQLVDRLTDPQLLKSGHNPTSGVAHHDFIQSLAFNPDGTLLASGSYREVKLWRRIANSQKLKLPTVSRNSVFAIALSPDDQVLATGGDDGRIRLWNLATGKAIRSLAGHKSAVTCLKFSSDGTLLCSCSTDRTIKVWDLRSSKLFATAESPEPVNAVTWIDSGKQIVSGGNDHVIRVWYPDLVKKELTPLKEIKGHEGPVTALDTISSATMQILSGSGDGSLRVWDVTDGKLVREMKHGGPIAAVAVRPDGKRFGSAGLNGVARLWDAADGKQLADLKGDWRVQELAAEADRLFAFTKSEVDFFKGSLKSAETNQLAVAGRVKKAKEANEKAEKALAEVQKKATDAREAKVASEKAVEESQALVKKSNEAVASAQKETQESETTATKVKENAAQAGEAGAKTVAEVETKLKAARESKTAADKAASEAKEKEKQASEKLTAANKTLEDVEKELKKAELGKSTADTELQLARKADDQTAKTAQVAKQTVDSAESEQKRAETELEAARKTAADSEQPLRSIAFSRENLSVATSGDDSSVRVWSAESGTPFDAFHDHAGAIFCSAFSDNGNLVSGTASRSVIVWNRKTPWTLERIIGTGDAISLLSDRVNAVKFSPDGLSLASGGGEPTRGGEIKLWDVASGNLACSFTNVHSDVVFALDFTRDGKYLASAAADRFAKVLEIATGKVVKQFEGHTGHVLGITWKKDSRTLASSGADNVIKFWDVVTGERKKNVGGSDKEVTSISFIGYSDQALVTSGDGKVRLIKEDGTEVRTFAGATDFVNSAATTPDGRIVVAGGQDGVLRVWNGTNGELIASFVTPVSESR
jgi:WD40 repeat protein